MNEAALIELQQQVNELQRQLNNAKIMPGGLTFIPVLKDLYDSTATQWGGARTAAVGTYTFDPSDANNAVSDLLAGGALLIYLSGSWAAAANTSWAGARPNTGGVNYFTLRALVANINSDAQGVVTTNNVNGKIDVVVNGATLNNGLVRLIGIFI